MSEYEKFFDKILNLKIDLGCMKQALDCQVLRVDT